MRDFTDDLRDVRRRLDEASEYLKIAESRNRLIELESEISRPDLWDDAERAKQVNTDYANVKADVADQRDLLTDVVARRDLLDHLALNDLDHSGGLLVGEASLLQAADRVGGIHPMASGVASTSR